MKDSGLTFGPWFKQQRLLAQMTQDEVAKATGLHKITISKIENGQPISEETAAALADSVGAPKDEAVFRSLKVSLAAMTPENERARRAIRLIDRIPADKFDAWYGIAEAAAEALTP